MMKRWKHKTPHLRRKTKNEVSFVFKLIMCGSSMNNVILCLFPVVFILCLFPVVFILCETMCSLVLCFVLCFYVMFVILMFVFNFNVFVYHCPRIFLFLMI